MPRSTARTMSALTFQRRHYQFIADVIKDYQADYYSSSTIVQAFVRALRGTNPGFDSSRFIDACGPTLDPPVKCLLCQSCECQKTR